MKKLTTVILLCAMALLHASCTDGGKPNTNSGNTSSNTDNKNANTTDTPKDDIPTSVKAAFPDAQSITKQQKEVPAEEIKELEEEMGIKIPDKNHTAYLAYKTEGGTRKQIGAATVLKVNDKEMLAIYESKDGNPMFKEVRADGVAAPFLAQFKGKGHEDKLQIGKDIKAEGVDAAFANAIASALRLDVALMSVVHGKGHGSH